MTTAITAGLVFWTPSQMEKTTPPKESYAAGTVTQVNESVTREEIPAPNGKMTLTVNNNRKEDITTQTFSITTEKEKTPLEVYSEESPADKPIQVPFNTFSPDNKYIYLKFESSGKPEYKVLRTDGKNIKGEEKTVEITDLFYKKFQDFTITDITGWAGNGLIVVNTDLLDGKTGPSFWFDLYNFSFIRLSTRFN